MNLNILTICYLLASVTFILGLKMLSNPVSARKGNLTAAAGMIIAIAGTIFLYEERLFFYRFLFIGYTQNRVFIILQKQIAVCFFLLYLDWLPTV